MDSNLDIFNHSGTQPYIYDDPRPKQEINSGWSQTAPKDYIPKKQYICIIFSRNENVDDDHGGQDRSNETHRSGGHLGLGYAHG